jgi:hypothetical protein
MSKTKLIGMIKSNEFLEYTESFSDGKEFYPASMDILGKFIGGNRLP